MGVHYDASRRKYVVRWQADGRRSRRFESEAEAVAFAQTVATPPPRGAASPTPARAPGRPASPAADLAPAPTRSVRRSSRGDGIYQLGHRSITTTEEHYGHLEQPFMREAVARTESAISHGAPAGAGPRPSFGVGD